MRPHLLALALLAACSPAPTQTADTPALPPPAAGPWFICDGIDQPVVLVFERDGESSGARVRVAEYSKAALQQPQITEFTLGESEGAAGSVYVALRRDGQDAGHVRQLNPGVLETPGAAYTTPITSVRIGEREISCRWMARTRLNGFSENASFVVHEDADGDLIYSSYDFSSAGHVNPIELSDGGRTTPFSSEFRGGDEAIDAYGVRFRFHTTSETDLLVTYARHGTGRLEFQQDRRVVHSAPMISAQQGAANLE